MNRSMNVPALALLAAATLTGVALADFPEPEGEIEIVQAKATKYAWIAENAEYVFDKIRPAEGSAFLVVEIEANVTYDQEGDFRSSVVIESAKGNKRGPAFGIADEGNLTTDEYVWDAAFDQKGKTRRMLYRFVFVVPEPTTEATLVMHDERAKLEFGGAPAEYPPVGSGLVDAEVVSTKFVDERPDFFLEARDIDVERSPGPAIKLVRSYEPAFPKYAAVELRFARRDAAAAYVDGSFDFQDSDFVAAYDDGVAYPGRCKSWTPGELDGEEKPLEMSGTVYFPVPTGVTKGTVYLRQTPIAELDVPK